MQNINQFFIHCSGISQTLLKRAPSDLNKYVGIGATIFFTGILASIAAGFALYTIFDSFLIAIPFGLVWGLMIFNLDRFIVSSMKDRGSKIQNFTSAMPRLLLAVVIAMVISKPLELKIFQTEIASELVTMEQEKYKDQEVLLKSRFGPEIASIKNEIKSKDQLLLASETRVNDLRNEAINEADGTGGSQIRNMGPIFKLKQATFEKSKAEHEALLSQTNVERDALNSKLSEIELKESEALSDLQLLPLNGFAAQLNALGRLCANNNTIWLASLFITLLFICIETTPIFAKLISRRSPYDIVLHNLEHKYEMNNKSLVTKTELETLTKLDYLNKTKNYQSTQLASAENEIFKDALSRKVEEEKQKVRTWKEVLSGPSLNVD
jgi:hypothetical protein